MRILLTTLLLAFVSHLIAQTPDPLAYRIERHLYFARYAEAKTEAEAAVQQRAAQPNSLPYAISLAELGLVRSSFAQYMAADSLLSAALTLLEQNKATADSVYLKTCTWAAENCRSLAQYPQAETLLKQGLAAADACKGSPHEAFRAGLLLEYANWDNDMSRFQQADGHYEQALAFSEKTFGRKSIQVAIALTAWGGFKNGTTANYREAELLLDKAIKILEPIAQQYPVEYLTTVIQQAQLYSWGLPRYRESQQILEKAEAFGRKYLGQYHPSLAWTLRVLAGYYQSNTPFFHRSDTLYREAKDIYTYHFGENYPSNIGVLQDLSEWQSSLGYPEKAAQIRQEAFERCRKVYGDRHPTTANLLLAFAETQKDAGNPLPADSLLQVVDTLYRSFFGGLHTSRIKILKTQASFAGSKQNYQLEDSILHQVLALQEQLHGRGSPGWWNTIDRIGTLAWATGRPARADSLFHAEMLFKKIKYGENSLACASSWRSFYFLYNSSTSNKPLEAEKSIRKNLSIVESAIGRDNWYYLFGLNQLFSTLTKQRRFSEAETVLSEQEMIAKTVYGEQSGAFVSIVENKVELIEKNHPPAEGISLRQQAVQLNLAMGDKVNYIQNLNELASSLAKIGQYATADSIIEILLPLALKQYGNADGNYLIVLVRAAFLYDGTYDYPKMRACLDSAAAVDKRIGREWEDVLNGVFGIYYYGVGQYDKAANMWLQKLVKKPDAGNHNQYARILTAMQQYAKADSILRIGLSKVDNEPEIEIALLINISANFSGWGKHKEAFEYTVKALEKSRAQYGENHPDHGVALNGYAMNLGSLGRYTEAEAAYRKCLSINERNGGTDDPEYATSLTNLGLHLWQLGRVEEAERLTIQAIKIREKKLGTDHPDCMSSRQRLADIYSYHDWKPIESDSLLRTVVTYWEKRGPKSREYANVLSAQGAFYRYIGEFEKSEQSIKSASAIFTSILGEQSWEIGNCFNDLGNTYREKARQTQGQAKKDLLGQALECVKKSLASEISLGGTERTNVAVLLQNIGNVYFGMGKADSAEHYLLRSLALQKKLHGGNNSAYGGTLSSLAGIYEMQNRYQEAIDTGLNALTILAETTGKNTEDYLLCARGMGSTLLASGRGEEAFSYLEEDQKAVALKIKKVFAYLSIEEQIKTIQRYKPDFYYSAALGYRHPELARICYNNTLRFKGAGLRNRRSFRDALGASPDTTLRQIFDQYIIVEKSMAAEYNLPPEQRTRLDSLQNASRGLERILIATSPEYKEYIDKLSITWQSVQSKLKPGEAAIEFIRYNRTRVIETDTFLYAALVLLPGRNAPNFVPLCREKDIDTLRQEQVRRDGFPLALYRPSEQSRAGSTGKKFNLYDSVWRPLDSLLAGVKRIYYAPDGLLHRVSFAALGYMEKSGGKVFLTDRFELVQVASTRQLAEVPKIKPVMGKGALVVGEIDYGTPSIPATTRAGSDLVAMFEPLEAPKDTSEFDTACNLFGQNDQEVTALSGKSATETAVVAQLSKATPYRSVCLITHGFFLPDQRYKSKMRHLFSEVNPMQRSGLVFAGVNEADSAANYNQDGLLTAQDFAGLNLQGTEVVLIPACQSGLGDVIGSEGVFGLQRAFRAAGVRYLIISLWDLPNEKTGIFMKVFYDLWLKQGKPVPEAFRLTQQQLRDTKDWDVSDWAGLILIE